MMTGLLLLLLVVVVLLFLVVAVELHLQEVLVEEEEEAHPLLRGLYKARREKLHAKSRTRLEDASHVTRHTSHVTRHTSHITRHTSHVTRHTSHITQAFYANHNRKRGALRKEAMRCAHCHVTSACFVPVPCPCHHFK